MRSLRLIWPVVTTFLICLTLSLTHSLTARSAEPPSVFLLLIDRLTIADLMHPEAEALRGVASHGGVGLSNVRTGGGGPASGYLSLAAGGRAVTGEWSGHAFSVEEVVRGQPAGELYRTLTGLEPGEGIVHLGINELKWLAAAQERESTPGLVGHVLRQAELPVTVYGNSDTPRVVGRYGVLVAMDQSGRATGVVDRSLLVADPEWPYEMRTDYDKLWEHLIGHVGRPGLVVVDFGDIARLEEIEPPMADEHRERLRASVVRRIGELTERLIESVRATQTPTAIMVVVPSPSLRDLQSGYLVTPIVYGRWNMEDRAHQGSGGAMLTSATTRRDGIVANLDIGATLIDLFGLDPAGGGRPITFRAHPDPWSESMALYHRITRVHSQRLPLIQPYFFVQLATVVGSTLLAVGVSVWGWRVAMWRRVILPLNLLLTSFPLTLVLLPLLPGVRGMPTLWLQTLAVALVLAGFGWLFRRRHDALPFTVVSALTVLVLVIDLLTGTRLMQSSHLGYDPIGGSRYYGIGNEYMGVLLGSAIVAAGGVLDAVPRTRRRATLVLLGLVFLLITFLLASPLHGANVGGTISAVVGLGAVMIMFVRERLALRDLAFLAVAVGLVVGAAAWYDTTVAGPDSSHLGNAVQQVGAEGTDPLWNLFERKIAMNARLIRLTIWSRAFLVSLLASLLLAFYPPRSVERLLGQYPNTGTAIRASLIGAFVVLLVNDSGIVGAATLMIPVISTLLYLVLCLADKERRSSPGAGVGQVSGEESVMLKHDM